MPDAKKILVTGSAGFIGFHQTRSLLEAGHRVVGLDNFNDYYDVSLKENRNALLESHETFRLERMDLGEADRLTALCRDERFDLICHLAAQAGVRYSLENPLAYGRSNLLGFLNVLEACRRAETPRLVYASSSSVYGGNEKLPFSETDPVDEPVSLYAATKKSNELLAHAYAHLYGFQTIGLRFFTVYGPWGRPDMAYWLFTEAMLAGKAIRVFNEGNMERDFTYIDDIIRGVSAALFTPGLAACEVFNLGNHRAEKLLDFIRVLGEALGVEPVLEMAPMQPGDVPSTYADVEKARTRLGFEPATSIREGLPRFAEWYRAHYTC